MLQRYAKEQGFTVYDEYVDDGISGTTFDRPEFKRMLRDIEGGKIGVVVCKAAMLNDLIDSIVIYDAEGTGRKDRKQKIEISYKFIGLMQMDERKSA